MYTKDSERVRVRERICATKLIPWDQLFVSQPCSPAFASPPDIERNEEEKRANEDEETAHGNVLCSDRLRSKRKKIDKREREG